MSTADDWETDADFENNLTDEQRRRAGTAEALAQQAQARSLGRMSSLDDFKPIATTSPRSQPVDLTNRTSSFKDNPFVAGSKGAGCDASLTRASHPVQLPQRRSSFGDRGQRVSNEEMDPPQPPPRSRQNPGQHAAVKQPRASPAVVEPAATEPAATEPAAVELLKARTAAELEATEALTELHTVASGATSGAKPSIRSQPPPSFPFACIWCLGRGK